MNERFEQFMSWVIEFLEIYSELIVLSIGY